mgnify:CR=1 FL=1
MTSGPDGGGDAAVGNGSTTGSPDPPGTAHGGRLDVVVLAGGTGRRLGGASKPDVVARGARLLDHVLAGLSGLTDLAEPASGAEPTGRSAPEKRSPAELTAVVTCDAPESGRALPALVAAARNAQDADGACALDGDHVQYLLGVYRTAALTQCVAPGGAALRDVSVRRALGGLSVVHVDLGELRSAARDLDTWEDVRAWDRH